MCSYRCHGDSVHRSGDAEDVADHVTVDLRGSVPALCHHRSTVAHRNEGQGATGI